MWNVYNIAFVLLGCVLGPIVMAFEKREKVLRPRMQDSRTLVLTPESLS